jgi:hypothetical protein
MHRKTILEIRDDKRALLERERMHNAKCRKKLVEMVTLYGGCHVTSFTVSHSPSHSHVILKTSRMVFLNNGQKSVQMIYYFKKFIY